MRLHAGPSLGLSATIKRFRPVRIRQFQRTFHDDGRNRISSFFIPTGGIASPSQDENGNEKLIRAGFLRSIAPGVFHMLPLGLRVQEKIERLVDKHMRSLGASKLSLSSLSRIELWEKSNRLDDSTMFRIAAKDNQSKDTFVLAPTHEEEITHLVDGLVKSYKDVPLRVYQISRKYRDERRPRRGLLRAKEFTMKDLYTFDYNAPDAMETYKSVKDAYVRLFDELKLPYLVAAACSGNMGGNLSHEFHITSGEGEDTVFSCSSCGHTFNEEFNNGKFSYPEGPVTRRGWMTDAATPVSTSERCERHESLFISKDGNTLVRAYYPKTLGNGKLDATTRVVNPHVVASVSRMMYGIELDLGVLPQFVPAKWQARRAGLQETPGGKNLATILDLFDFRVLGSERPQRDPSLFDGIPKGSRLCYISSGGDPNNTDDLLDLIKVQTGDTCPKCGEGALEGRSAIELAHTFYLGTRYSGPFEAKVAVDPATLSEKLGGTDAEQAVVPLEMGCHGIGVSRMIGAVACALADSKGLNWPSVIAPFQAVIVPAAGLEKEAEQIYDMIREKAEDVDVVLDDRRKRMAWKLGDADLIGYPVIIVVGKNWTAKQRLEVQCRRLGLRAGDICLEGLPPYIRGLLEKL